MFKRNPILEDEIIRTIYDSSSNKFITAYCRKAFLKRKGFYSYLESLYSNITNEESSPLFLKEILYRLVNHIDEVPRCKMCNSPLRFNGKKFPTYCSKKCSNSDPEVIQKNKEGVSRTQKLNYQLYGDSIKAKRMKTLKELYNLDSSTCSPFGC